MTVDSLRMLLGGNVPISRDQAKTRWAKLAEDFVRLPAVSVGDTDDPTRDVGELLLNGHEEALAEAESYVVEGHTARTGALVEVDDIDDHEEIERWARELDDASRRGWAPPAPAGFWGAFLRWRTPLGMARLTERRIPRAR